MHLDPVLLRNFALALFIGALVGIEREKKLSDTHRGFGGIRTFILFAQAGALSAWLSLQASGPWIFVAGFAVASAAVLAGYVLQARVRPESLGLTSEMAAISVFLLGGATLYGHAEISVALAIVTSAVLAFKEPMHVMVSKLGRDDIYAGLKLLLASFVVLPLLPNQTVDPWGVLNPYKMWLVVVLISLLSLAGYVAVRWLGTERGLALTGLTGGLVSSTVVSLSFAKRSREGAMTPRLANALVAGVLLAWLVMVLRVLAIAAAVNPALFARLLAPLALLGGVTALLALLALGRSSGREPVPDGAPPDMRLRNPFSLWEAFKFALFFTAVLVVVQLAQTHYPGQGVLIVAALAGLTDVDAITLSMAEQARHAGAETLAAQAILLASATSTAVKCGIIVALGAPALKGRMLLATLAILAAAAAAFYMIG
jgi:uncharacterized membrane protein (DUF4010 family)